MKFGIITHAIHKVENGKVYAYEPYVREMNLWAKYVDEIIVLAPVSKKKITDIEIAYLHPSIKVVTIPNFDITSIKNLVKTLLVIPKICWCIFKVLKQVNHIHLRCPGNVGLLGCFLQILFPSKPKTIKYAGNWDPESENQPFSYRLQKRIVSNTFFTKNCQVLVYGNWKNQTKNIKPFFTATYSEKEIEFIPDKTLEDKINFIFVGGLTPGKQPLLSVEMIHKLKVINSNIHLDVFGDGVERLNLEDYIKNNKLESNVTLHGNVRKEVVKTAFQNAHFLLFVSKSEGWPKVVAEAMFWGAIPITSKVSCIPYMIGHGTRGTLVDSNSESMLLAVEDYMNNKKNYVVQSRNAMHWSQNYTLEKFETEIAKLLND
jgi:glycosyltransferase involved in cell wall biosynthesis